MPTSAIVDVVNAEGPAVSEAEQMYDALAAGEIVAAAISEWEPAATHGRRVGKLRTTESFALAARCSSAESQSAVTLSFLRVPPEVFFDWLGPRLVFWPAGIVRQRRTSVVSSRIGKRKDLKHGWFDALRTVAIRQKATECLCCVGGTAAADAVVRAAELFGARRLRIEVEPGGNASEAELIQWLESKASVQHRSESPLEDVVYLSPRYRSETSGPSRDGDNVRQLPVRDTALVLAAERIMVLSCRAGGHVESLLKRQLQDERCEAPVLLASVAASEAESVSPSLVSLGAVPWLLGRGSGGAVERSTSVRDTGFSRIRRPKLPRTSVSDGPLHAPEQWLCHWTRPRQGPWGEQTDEEFLDELILGCRTADRSAYAALMRMVEQRQITASRSVTNAARTVSFTAVPLGDFRDRRVYRKHKQRFDFEPWGLAVRKAALEVCGCRPVCYVTREAYDDAADGDRLFQQVRTDEGHKIDWSQEHEWRYAGDLDLSQFGAEDVCAFVDTHDEATALSTVAPWRVLQLPAMRKPA